MTVDATGTLSGYGSINALTTVNGAMRPSLGNTLVFKQGLILNNNSTFILQAGGGNGWLRPKLIVIQYQRQRDAGACLVGQ